MRKFNKKYLSALVLSCVTSLALANPDAGEYVTDDTAAVSEGSGFGGVKDWFYNPNNCCSNIGAIVGGILQVGFAAAAADSSKKDHDLVRLEDIGRPDGFNGPIEAFLPEIGVGDVPGPINGSINLLLFPNLVFSTGSANSLLGIFGGNRAVSLGRYLSSDLNPSGLSSSLFPHLPLSLFVPSVEFYAVPSAMGLSALGLGSLGVSTVLAPWLSASFNSALGISSLPSVAPSALSFSSLGSWALAAGSSSVAPSLLGSSSIPGSSAALSSLPLNSSAALLSSSGTPLLGSSSGIGSSLLALPLSASAQGISAGVNSALGLSSSFGPSLSSIPASLSAEASSLLSAPLWTSFNAAVLLHGSLIGSFLSSNASAASSLVPASGSLVSSLSFAPLSLVGSSLSGLAIALLTSSFSVGNSAIAQSLVVYSLGLSALGSTVSAPLSAISAPLSAALILPSLSASSVPYSLAASSASGAGSLSAVTGSLAVSSSIPLSSSVLPSQSASTVSGSGSLSGAGISLLPPSGLAASAALSSTSGVSLLASAGVLSVLGSVSGLLSLPASSIPSVTSSGLPAFSLAGSSALYGSKYSLSLLSIPGSSSAVPALSSGSLGTLPPLSSAAALSSLPLSSLGASLMGSSLPVASSNTVSSSLPLSSSIVPGSAALVTGSAAGISATFAGSAASSAAGSGSGAAVLTSSSLIPSSSLLSLPAQSLSGSAGGMESVTSLLGSSALTNSAVSAPSGLLSLSSSASPYLIPLSSSAVGSSALTSGTVSSSVAGTLSVLNSSSSSVPNFSSLSAQPSASLLGSSAVSNFALSASGGGSALSEFASSSVLSAASFPVAFSSTTVSGNLYFGFSSANVGALGWRVFHPSLSTWKYGYANFDYFNKSDDFEFRNLVTFGDSLSDTGAAGRGSVYLGDGNPYAFYNSYLSLLYTGKINTPERAGGSNYAMSGSVLKKSAMSIEDWLVPRDSVVKQVQRYLTRNGGLANKDDVFVIWGGGNDVTRDIQKEIFEPWHWNGFFNGFPENDNFLGGYPWGGKAALVPGQLAATLNAAGAEGPIVILNLPSPGPTPFTGALLSSLIDSNFILINDTPFDIINLGRILERHQDEFLRNPANRVGELGAGNGLEYFRENTINGMVDTYGYIIPKFMRSVIKPLMATVFDLSYAAQNNTVNLFNREQKKEVELLVGNAKNIVQLDINGLFAEIINDPLSFGIDEILVPECTIGRIAPACDAGDKWYHGDDGRHYMYTDWHHPSALTHRIIAEYIASTLNAPAYITALSRSLETGAKARTDYLKSELTRVNARPYEGQGQTYVFGGFSGGYSKENRSLNNRGIVYNGLNVGFGYRPMEGFDIGLLGSLGISKVKPHKNMKFDQKDYGISAFAQYTTGPWWVSGILSAAKTNFDNIKRSVVMGQNARAEKGETDGKTYGGSLESGYEFLAADTWVIAPFLGYSKYRYKVDAFEEEGNTSSSMRFMKQKRDQEYATLGLRVSDDCPDDSQLLRGSVDLTVNRNINEDKAKLIGEGGLKRFNTNFTREANRIVKDSKTWIEIKPTVQFKISNHARITTSVNYAFDTKNKSQNKNLSYSVGYRQEL